MKTELETRSTIREIQALLLSVPGQLLVNPPVEHEALNGLYMRKIALPAQAVIVGKTHKKDHILIINRGGGIMLNEHGKFTVRHGDVISCRQKTKRVFKAERLGMEIITIHPNPENKPIKELEQDLVEDI